jgi:hypothetical protein
MIPQEREMIATLLERLKRAEGPPKDLEKQRREIELLDNAAQNRSGTERWIQPIYKREGAETRQRRRPAGRCCAAALGCSD